MSNVAANESAAERARVRAWMKRAEKPSDWKGRDQGDPRRVAELRVLLEWVNDMLAAASSPHRQLPPWWDDEYRRGRMLQLQAGTRGAVSLSTALAADLDVALRQQLLGPDALEELLGYTDADGAFTPGLAGLTPQERDAIWYSLDLGEDGRPRSLSAIRDLMDRRRNRRYGLPLAIESVEQYLSRGRVKLRKMLAA